jgi:hypothetical protein
MPGPVIAIAAIKQQAEQYQHSNQGSPLLIVRKKAEKDKTEIGRNNRPAGTISIPANRTGGIPNTVNKSPSDQRRNNDPQKIQGNDRKQRV